MSSAFDLSQFDGILLESLHQAAVENLSEDDLVTRLRQHADAIDDHGLDTHTRVASIPAVSEDHSERESEPTP